ncbi:GatB/YqeY domain-containing protein [Sphingomonas insulae]|uniref:GatB/YqeY domain-containing protein n=2 Tax=Sphingomonas insulae TaxID=424800 RepID=A0ABP3T3I9_9SPHN
MAGTPQGFVYVAKWRPLDPCPREVNRFTGSRSSARLTRFTRRYESFPMIRDDIKAAQVTAMKAGDKESRNAISLIQAAIKNRDIELRTGGATPDDDAIVVEVLQKMVKQRRESIAMYETGGRQELADAEKAEVAVIERFLPAQMSEADTTAAILAIKAELGATGMKDMGRVMAELKARHAASLDMSKASGLVKAALS